MADVSKVIVADLCYEACKILAEHREGMHYKRLFEAVKERYPIPEAFLQENPKVPGGLKFHNSIGWYTGAEVKADWLIKDGWGLWTLTDAGREALDRFPTAEAFHGEATRFYNEWERGQAEIKANAKVNFAVRLWPLENPQGLIAVKASDRLTVAQWTLFDLAARHAGEVITTTDIGRELNGLTRHQVTVRLQGLTRLLQEVAGTEYWPVGSAKGHADEQGFIMDPRIAQIWLGEESPASIRVWIETTRIRNRPDRLDGDYALGKALWYPKTSANGTNIYRSVRDVHPGDVVLHLTDSEGFTGTSCAAGPARDLEHPPPNTEWSDQPCFWVPLENFHQLQPPLLRTQFFESPYGERLRAIIEAGARNLFFDGDLSLNEGPHLTPCPPDLLEVLNDAYREVTGQDLLPPVQVVMGRDRGDELVRLTNTTDEQITELKDLLEAKRQIIFEGPPGSGKTFIADKFARYLTGNPLEGHRNDRLVLVQFHQSYGYEDFIQGIRPNTDGGQLSYVLQDGIFKQLCERAARRPEEEFVIVIDEINRGNIARIFGELLLLLEYRNEEVPLPYERPGQPPFRIPSNVNVIGTMNTADRSLAQIDYALRRRFYFYEFAPVVDGRAPYLERWLAASTVNADSQELVLNLFLALNRRIATELGEDFLVGHSYFMNPDILTEEGRQRIWRRAILPLLKEYFHNRRDRSDLLKSLSLSALTTGSDFSGGVVAAP